MEFDIKSCFGLWVKDKTCRLDRQSRKGRNADGRRRLRTVAGLRTRLGIRRVETGLRYPEDLQLPAEVRLPGWLTVQELLDPCRTPSPMRQTPQESTRFDWSFSTVTNRVPVHLPFLNLKVLPRTRNSPGSQKPVKGDFWARQALERRRSLVA